MKKKMAYLSLHSPLFHAGTQWGTQLFTNHSKGKLEMTWDTEERTFEVVGNGVTSWLPETSVFQYSDVDPRKNNGQQIFNSTRVIPKAAQVGGPERFQAQVSTPQDKVQGKPGRKAKYQGEDVQGE